MLQEEMPSQIEPGVGGEMGELVKGLTAPQQQAVQTTEGPLLVLAGAGSGKTRVITRRIAFLIHQGVPPWSILAVTFTNKAAAEMRERVMTVLGHDPRLTRGLTVTTFHSLCARLLRRYAEAAGLKPEFSIYDSNDQSALAKKVIAELQLSTSNWPPRSVLSAISSAKNELLDADEFAARAHDFYSRTVAKIYQGYQKALKLAGAVDFDDLLVLTAKLLQNNTEIRQECNDRWRYLLIDEYQDTNHAQFVIASLIAGKNEEERPPNICVVGDPDQAIYGWRGADIANILEFEKNYPGTKVIMLGENFRSTAPILKVADTLIRNNIKRKHKDLFTSRTGGERVEISLARDENHEAALVVDWLRSVKDEREDSPNPIAWREMAIFYRTNSLSRVMEDALRSAAIPYTIARGTAFYEREEVKNAIAYLRVVANPSDGVSLARIVNTPTRGIGATTYGKIEDAAAHQGKPVLEVMHDAYGLGEIAGRGAAAVGKFVQMLGEWTGGGTFMGAQVPTGLADLVSRIIRESGLEAMYRTQAKASGSDADLERLDNLDELVSSARQFEMEFDAMADPAAENADGLARPSDQTPPLLAMLRAYLESIALVADADAVDPAQGAITLMTLHAAKGLEFKAVAMIGLEEGQLPHSRARESQEQLEEERRLCFVGITRAMRRLHLTSSRYRTMRGIPERTIPSRFLEELPKDSVLISDQADALGDLDDFIERGEGGGGGGGGGQRFEAEGEFAARDSKRAKLAWSGTGKLGAKSSPFPVGSTVRHPQFGEGEVVSITAGANARATIRFRGVGTKTLVLEYARLTRVK
ncbi:MAG: UvrD-helicase domain-containing protein [Phycisphaeraceae bacterium]|nr:UvrD-helicase domain-containing protein [Phycisphaeraceae bacterium]